MQITYIEYDLPVDDVLASTCGFRTWAERHGFVMVARVGELVRAISQKYSDKHLSISLPSLRIESFSVELAELLKDGRQTGFTFAPEAATEAMRCRINKYIPDQQLLDTAREVFTRGWRTIKLYFMIGHPDETRDDVQAIADLARAVLKEGRRVHGKAAQVNIGCSTFVPKPHTPFQWVPLDSEASVRAKQALLKSELRGPGLKLSWTEPEQTSLEAFLSCGDRRLSPVILRAWQLGAEFDAWDEHMKTEAWRQAFAERGLEPEFYTLDLSAMMQRLMLTLPAGIGIASIVEVPLNVPALQAALRWAEYLVTLETDEPQAQIEAKVQALVTAATLSRERRGKSYDLRPLVLELSLESVPPSVQLVMRLKADATAGTGRPDEVLAALGWGYAPSRSQSHEILEGLFG